jgi:hypothetical protein
MFNPYSVPGFAASLLFWLLAAYVLTRGPLSLVSGMAAAAQVATAVYFLGQGMQANATTLDEWLPWSRNLFWGATVAPAAWCWLTLLLLREQRTDRARAFLRRVGYPIGWAFAALGLALTVALFAGDGLFVWSEPLALPPERATSARFDARPGPLYALLPAHLVGATLAAAGFLFVGRRLAEDEERRRLFGWLMIWALVMVPAASAFSVATWLGVELWSIWVTDVAVALTAGMMTANAGAYGLLVRGRVIRADLLYFLTMLGLLCALYVAVFWLVGPPFSFPLLVLLVAVLLLTVAALGLAPLARRAFDRLFFSDEVRRVRSGLDAAAQDAALSPDESLGRLVDRAHTELAVVSAEHDARLTQEALRRLNAPAGLATCGLIERLPRTLAHIRAREAAQAGNGLAVPAEPTPLEQARALRTAVVEAVERLRPADPNDPGAPAALQYHILHEAYVLGRPNKQIMARRGISEGTFHRNRREAVGVLARELIGQEERLPSE